MPTVVKAIVAALLVSAAMPGHSEVRAQETGVISDTGQDQSAQRARRERGLPFSCGYDYSRRRGQLSQILSSNDADRFCFDINEYTRIFREEVGVREATSPENLIAYLNSPAVVELPMSDPRVDLRHMEVYRRESDQDYSTFRRPHRAADRNGTVLYSEQYGVIMIASCLNPVIDASVQGPRTLPPPPPVGFGIAVSPS